MAVNTSYSFGFVESIDPFSMTGNADAASLAGGGVVVSGDHIGHTDATLFQPDGDIAGSAAVISGTESAVSQLSNGNVVIATDNGNQASFHIVSSTGATVVGDTASDIAFTQLLDVDVTGLTGGGFVVASQAFFGGTDNDIRINIRNNDGSAVTSFSVDSATANNDQNPSVAGLADGGFAVAWHRNVGSTNDMYFAVYNADGTVRRAPTLLDGFGTFNRNASVVALDNGGFAIAYEDTGWNGDVGGDLDITLARFDSAGNQVGGFTDISQNSFNDETPSLTQLSNGMLAVGSVSDQFGAADQDPTWTLVDQNTGERLGSSGTGLTGIDDIQTSIAAMNNGQIGAFFTTSGDVTGQILQAQRFSTGDAANDVIVGDDLQDIVSGGAGADTIRGGLNADILNGDAGSDTFQLAAGEVLSGETIDGGGDVDTILALSNVSLVNATVSSIEEIEFNFPNATTTTVNVRADQIGAGLAANLLIDGNANNVSDRLRVLMGADTVVDLSAFTFQNFDTGGTEDDRMYVIGDNDAERITGSSVRDDVTGSGGNDSLNGGDGKDVLRGGLGDDLYTVDEAGEAIEGGNQGVDTVRSNVNYVLGNNIENLTLIGGGAINGTGNTLANTLIGNDDVNSLNGLGGDDTLTGGAAPDRFLFTTALNPATNVDTITDFKVGVDEIRLDDAVFAALPTGALAAGAFRIGGAAGDANDRIIYNAANGNLFYDADGTGAGAKTLFAVLDPGLAPTAGDFVVI